MWYFPNQLAQGTSPSTIATEGFTLYWINHLCLGYKVCLLWGPSSPLPVPFILYLSLQSLSLTPRWFSLCPELWYRPFTHQNAQWLTFHCSQGVVFILTRVTLKRYKCNFKFSEILEGALLGHWGPPAAWHHTQITPPTYGEGQPRFLDLDGSPTIKGHRMVFVSTGL